MIQNELISWSILRGYKNFLFWHSHNIIIAIQIVSKSLNKFADNPVNDLGQVLTVVGYKTVKLRFLLPPGKQHSYNYWGWVEGQAIRRTIKLQKCIMHSII